LSSTSKYLDEYGGNLLFLNELINITQDILNPRVLDFGCGNGTLAYFLSSYSEIVGIEKSKERYDEARRKIRCFYNSHDSIPNDIGFFDLIYCKEVLPSIKDKSKFYNSVYNTLNEKGFFCSYLPEKMDMINKPLYRFISLDKIHKNDSLKGISTNIQILNDVGFTNIKTTRIPLGSLWINENYALKHWNGFFNNFERKFSNDRKDGLMKMISSINKLLKEGITIHYEFERTMIIAQK
jgi:SAM-dependent methyltransferase